VGKKRIIAKVELSSTKVELSSTKAETGEVTLLPKVNLGLDQGLVFVNSSYNNTIISLASPGGDILTWVSAGHLGFKGTRKSTPFAASKVAETLADRAKKIGVLKVGVIIKGIGSGRESALRSLASRGLEIISIKDATPLPHNGCRPPKARRV
jgi:small subunit ribosomal protein S11